MNTSNRLRNTDDIRLLFMRGKRVDTPLFRMIVRKNHLAYARFLFVTPKTLDKRAVIRNRIRRRAREWIRIHVPIGATNLDIALVFKKAAPSASRAVLYEELSRTFSSL